MRLWKEGLKEQWSKGVFQREQPEYTAEANAAALGQLEVIDKFLELTAEQLEESLNGDEETIRRS